MSDFRFSVFTATYNRAHCLSQLYSDLLNQTFYDFEWVIVSDGSTDDTCSVVQSFIAEKKIPIQFIDKPNGGKHTAWKEATKIFRGIYVIGADDDDRMPSTALEIFDTAWKHLETQFCYNEIWEIRGRCSTSSGELVGLPFPEPYYDVFWNDVIYREQKACEMRSCRKLSVLKKEASVPDNIPYGDYVSNFPEIIRWSRASRRYKSRIIPNIVRIYNYGSESESLSFSKSKSEKLLYNDIVCCIFQLNEHRDYLLTYKNFISYIRCIKNLVQLSIRLKIAPSKYLNCKIDKFFFHSFRLICRVLKNIR